MRGLGRAPVASLWAWRVACGGLRASSIWYADLGHGSVARSVVVGRGRWVDSRVCSGWLMGGRECVGGGKNKRAPLRSGDVVDGREAVGHASCHLHPRHGRRA